MAPQLVPLLVRTLTTKTNPAWLDLPGAHDSRRHSPGCHKVTQASPPRQAHHRGRAEDVALVDLQ